MSQRLKYAVFGFLAAALGLWGLAVTIPNTFSGGEVVSAAKMNANFQALKAAVDTLEAKVATLESDNASLKTRLASVLADQRALPSRDGAVGYYQALSTGAPMSGAEYFNSSGGAIVYAVDGTTNVYTITFKGLGRHGGAGSPGVALANAMGVQAYDKACKAEVDDRFSDVVVTVYCYDISSGNPVPSTFSLLYVR